LAGVATLTIGAPHLGAPEVDVVSKKMIETSKFKVHDLAVRKTYKHEFRHIFKKHVMFR
jgi:hypothetical protein